MITVRLPSALRGGGNAGAGSGAGPGAGAGGGSSAGPGGGSGADSDAAPGARTGGDSGPGSGGELRIDEPVANLAQLVAALERLRPDLRDHLHDSLYNFAVNDALVLHGADDYPLQPGDIVEIIPTIAGG